MKIFELFFIVSMVINFIACGATFMSAINEQDGHFYMVSIFNFLVGVILLTIIIYDQNK